MTTPTPPGPRSRNRHGSFHATRWVESLHLTAGPNAVAAHRKVETLLAEIAQNTRFTRPGESVPDAVTAASSEFGPVEMSVGAMARVMGADTAKAARITALALGLLRPGQMRAAWESFTAGQPSLSPAKWRAAARNVAVVYPDGAQRAADTHRDRVAAAEQFIRERMPVAVYGSIERREALIRTLFHGETLWPAADCTWSPAWTADQRRAVATDLLAGRVPTGDAAPLPGPDPMEPAASGGVLSAQSPRQAASGPVSALTAQIRAGAAADQLPTFRSKRMRGLRADEERRMAQVAADSA